MSCAFPVTAYQPDPGAPLVFKNNGEFSNAKRIFIPCGRCKYCRLDYSQAWAVRITHEDQIHIENGKRSFFLTLTYDEKHLPENGFLRYKDFQKFLKRLREREAPNRIRYVVAGEYGEKTGRPHYHAILFGMDELIDAEFIGNSQKNDKPMYKSGYLDDLWQQGFVTVQSVTPQSAGYVASYALKDTKTAYKEREAKTVRNKEGDLESYPKPFLRMSLKPAIGIPFCEKYHKDGFSGDTIMYRGKQYPVPEVYIRWLSKFDPDEADRLRQIKQDYMATKEARKEKTPSRLKAKAICRDARLQAGRDGFMPHAAFSDPRYCVTGMQLAASFSEIEW